MFTAESLVGTEAEARRGLVDRTRSFLAKVFIGDTSSDTAGYSVTGTQWGSEATTVLDMSPHEIDEELGRAFGYFHIADESLARVDPDAPIATRRP